MINVYSAQNCILLFKELPLHLWIPTSHDMHVISKWLVDSPLTSSENLLARNILSGLNWGTKSEVCVCVCDVWSMCGTYVCVHALHVYVRTYVYLQWTWCKLKLILSWTFINSLFTFNFICSCTIALPFTTLFMSVIKKKNLYELYVRTYVYIVCCEESLTLSLLPPSQEGSSELVLSWSVHCSVAMTIVEAHTRHLPTQPGGRDYTPFTTLGKVWVVWGCDGVQEYVQVSFQLYMYI